MNPSSVDPSVISKPLAFKGFNVRISSILLVKGRGAINHGSTVLAHRIF